MLIRLEDIPRLSDIPASILNIEEKTRSNALPWKGQFSPELVEALLSKFANPEDRVIDPFVGSGTTLYECARLDIEATGIELNPAAFIMARIYLLSNLPNKQRKEILNSLQTSIFKIISNRKNIIDNLTTLYHRAPYFEQIVLGALIILTDLNKTNIKDELLTNWVKLYKLIEVLSYTKKNLSVILGDARNIPIIEEGYSLLLTSPPYINVINYHQQYRNSVERLGFPVLEIAKSEIGSNRKHRSNRFLTVIQYSMDISLFFKEAQRLCIDRAKMLVVIGRKSKINNVDILNTEIIASLGVRLGLYLLGRYERNYINRYGETILEDILVFENRKENRLFIDHVTIGKSIGESYLEHLLYDKSIGKNAKDLIEKALKKADIVKPSPFWEDIYVAT